MNFSMFPFSLYLIFDQTLSNVIVCLMISHNYIQKLHKRAGMLQWILGRFDCSQNVFEMEKNRIEKGPITILVWVS